MVNINKELSVVYFCVFGSFVLSIFLFLFASIGFLTLLQINMSLVENMAAA